MKYYLGIDGGGTKTAYLLTDQTGKTISQARTAGASYKEEGINGMLQTLKDGIEKCLAEADIPLGALAAAGLGLPCFGENKAEELQVSEAVRMLFPEIPLCITNDVEAGWAGSLGMEPGINVVAGTGSIAFGKNRKGETARSGGWSTFFGDEGSCYWLGRRTMELFSKQADGRLKKGALYELIRSEFGLTDDLEFIALMEEAYIPSRSKVASLQKLLLSAARQGDEAARMLYRDAAGELRMMIESIGAKLWKPGEEVLVSYSGGLFHAKELMLSGLTMEQVDTEIRSGYPMACPNDRKPLEKFGVRLRLEEPRFSPVQGAVLLAAGLESQTRMEQMIADWEREMR